MAGQAFQQLPGAEAPTAGGMAQMSYQRKANEIQNTFTKQWKAITSKSKKIGDQQTRQMLGQLQKQAHTAAQTLTKDFNDQQEYLNQVQKLSDAGLIANGEELMWKAVLGGAVSDSIYPKQLKPKTDMELFHAQDRENKQLEGEMEGFRTVGTSKYKFGGKRLGIPIIGRIEKGRETQKQVWDPDKGKDGGWDWVPATASESEYYKELQAIHAQGQTFKQALMSGGRLGRNAAKMALQPDGHSSFSDKVTGYKTLSKPPKKEPTRTDLLNEYKRLGGSKTAEGVAFANEHLR